MAAVRLRLSARSAGSRCLTWGRAVLFVIAPRPEQQAQPQFIAASQVTDHISIGMATGWVVSPIEADDKFDFLGRCDCPSWPVV